MKKENPEIKNNKKKGRAEKILGGVGTTLIIIVIVLCALLIVPKMFHFQMFHVISGSMEPEMPVGSLIYVREGEPEEVEEEDIIAFYGSLENEGVITHRVVKNNVISGTFQTKGDANEEEDPLPISYGNYIGQVKLTIPHMGKLLTCMTSLYGKIAAACVIVLGVILNLAGSFRKEKE